MAHEVASKVELVRALKQIIELRGAKQGRPEQESVTLFGKKLRVAVPKSEDHSSDSSSSSENSKMQPVAEKLPPAAIVHLKEFYEQHLKRRAPTSTSTVRQFNVESGTEAVTLPLLNAIEDEDSVGVKRQRTGMDQYRVSNSKPAKRPMFQEVRHAKFQAPIPEKERSDAAPPLTIFYEGKVYVFENMSADKATAIMILAGNANSCGSRSVESEGNAAGSKPAPERRTFTVADLPQARKASLQRFLEKRKDRLFVKSDKDLSSYKSESPAPSSTNDRSISPDPPACRKTCAEAAAVAELQPAREIQALQIQ